MGFAYIIRQEGVAQSKNKFGWLLVDSCFPALLVSRVVLKCVMAHSPCPLNETCREPISYSAVGIGLLICILLCMSSSLSFADNFICPPNDKIVSTGDNMYTVQGLCGPPVFKNQRTLFGGARGSVSTIVVDEWTYDLGPNRLKATLIFHNGILFQVVPHQ
jgi:hypothetical protein